MASSKTDVARHWWWSVVYGAAALVLALSVCRQGLTITPDSVSFMSATECLATGRGLRSELTPATVMTSTAPVVWFPPGYPALCALFSIGGLSLPRAMLFGTAVSFAAAAGLAFMFARGFCSTRWMPHAVAAAVLLFSPHLFLGTTMWSEMTYLALSIASLWLLATWMENENAGLLRLAAAGLLTSCTALTRYLGVSAFITGLIGIRLALRRRSLPESESRPWLRPLLVYGLTTCVPVWVWLVRNWVLTGTATGDRLLSKLTLSQNLRALAATLGRDFFPTQLPPWGHGAVLAIASFWLIVIALVLGRRGFWAELRTRLQSDLRLQLCVTYGLVYAYALACARTACHFDPITTRLTGPAYPFAIFLIAACVEQWWTSPAAGVPRVLRHVGLALLAAVLAGHLSQSITRLTAERKGRDEQDHRATVAWLKERVRPEEPVYARVAEMIWLHGRIPAKYPPRNAAELAQVRKLLQALPSSMNAYLLIYKGESGMEAGMGQDLPSGLGMFCVAELPAALVFARRHEGVKPIEDWRSHLAPIVEEGPTNEPAP